MNPRTLIPFHPLSQQKKNMFQITLLNSNPLKKKKNIPHYPPKKWKTTHPPLPHPKKTRKNIPSPPNFPPPPKSSHQILHPPTAFETCVLKANKSTAFAGPRSSTQPFKNSSPRRLRWLPWWLPTGGFGGHHWWVVGLALFYWCFCGWEFMIFIKTNLESCHLFFFQADFWFNVWKWVNPCCQEQSAISEGKQILKIQHRMIVVGQGCFKNLLVILSCCRSSRSKNPDEFWTKFWYPRVSLPFLLLWHGFGTSLYFQAHIMVQGSLYYLPKQCAIMYLIRNPSKLTYMWIKVSCFSHFFGSHLLNHPCVHLSFFPTCTLFETGKPPTGPPFQEEGIHFPLAGFDSSKLILKSSLWSMLWNKVHASVAFNSWVASSKPGGSKTTNRNKESNLKGFLKQHMDICYTYIVIHIRM